MGNTSSNPAAAHNLDPNSPGPRLASPGPPSPSQHHHPAHRVHRSLRNKKRSLELPDLASLALTPASSSPASVSPHPAYRRPRASSPIPIPISANPPRQTFGPQNNLPSAAHIHLRAENGRGARHKSYLSSAYPSTRSFVSGEPSPPQHEEPIKEFVPEVVHSTLPLALVKAEEESRLEPASVKVVWRGGGRSVTLARAGHDNWQGRQPMEFDSEKGEWYTYVSLMPGTHHLKYLVDNQWRTTDDYPTAADDRDGTLANYLTVPFPTSTSSPAIGPAPASASVSATTSPLASPHPAHPNHVNSFWSDSVSAGPTGERVRDVQQWTQEIPQELIAAAGEEEIYLASADMPSQHGGVPAPNIPPAPVLPRHLDKLILNVRPNQVSSPNSSMTKDERGRRERERRGGSRRDRDRGARPGGLGMTGTGDGEDESKLVLPVVSPSGTDVGMLPPPSPSLDAVNGKHGIAKLEAASGMADDASVLPVPSHVVLHHLSTSAIRNGVLAVANTTRYKKKYITTIYYKPT